jgi:hypothetical protein
MAPLARLAHSTCGRFPAFSAPTKLIGKGSTTHPTFSQKSVIFSLKRGDFLEVSRRP